MADPDLMSAVRFAFRSGAFVFTHHAYIRAKMEGLSTAEVSEAGAASELLEDYPDRIDGHTLLLLGYARSSGVHIVTNISGFESDSNEPVVVVTNYRPEPPAWSDDRTRGGSTHP